MTGDLDPPTIPHPTQEPGQLPPLPPEPSEPPQPPPIPIEDVPVRTDQYPFDSAPRVF